MGSAVVLAASYEAKAWVFHGDGRGAGPSAPPAGGGRFAADVGVRRRSRPVFELFEQTAPLVEGLSIDEAFLDVRGMEHISGSATEIAARLRHQVRQRIGLPITVGVARTKLLAKVASGVAKPERLLVVPPGTSAFLHPLPVERLWGVGPVTATQPRERGLATASAIDSAPRRVRARL